jgi:hypothetical protein
MASNAGIFIAGCIMYWIHFAESGTQHILLVVITQDLLVVSVCGMVLIHFIWISVLLVAQLYQVQLHTRWDKGIL